MPQRKNAGGRKSEQHPYHPHPKPSSVQSVVRGCASRIGLYGHQRACKNWPSTFLTILVCHHHPSYHLQSVAYLVSMREWRIDQWRQSSCNQLSWTSFHHHQRHINRHQLLPLARSLNCLSKKAMCRSHDIFSDVSLTIITNILPVTTHLVLPVMVVWRWRETAQLWCWIREAHFLSTS